MKVKIIFPDSPALTAECDSLKISVADDQKGDNGGSYGIRAKHAPALYALKKGSVHAELDGKCVLDAETGEGCARVDDNCVIVLSE